MTRITTDLHDRTVDEMGSSYDQWAWLGQSLVKTNGKFTWQFCRLYCKAFEQYDCVNDCETERCLISSGTS